MNILLFARRAIFVTSLLGIQFSAVAQGSLTPPGAPASTMKSLDQIEARTPVDAIHTPGDISDEFIISQPGSYYLTTNIIGVSAKYGILIATNNVTLDLNGFAVLGVPGAYDGIHVGTGPFYNIAIRNGTVDGWLLTGDFGIGGSMRNSTLENLSVYNNFNGIVCLDNTVVRNCNVSSNIMLGINVFGNGCAILDNVCNGNNATNGVNNACIYLNASNSRVEGNHISGSGPNGSGIFVISVGGATNNIIVRNSVISGGSKNFTVNASQIVGPLITNAASGFITNSNPWANFSL